MKASLITPLNTVFRPHMRIIEAGDMPADLPIPRHCRYVLSGEDMCDPKSGFLRSITYLGPILGGIRGRVVTGSLRPNGINRA